MVEREAEENVRDGRAHILAGSPAMGEVPVNEKQKGEAVAIGLVVAHEGIGDEGTKTMDVVVVLVTVSLGAGAEGCVVVNWVDGGVADPDKMVVVEKWGRMGVESSLCPELELPIDAKRVLANYENAPQDEVPVRRLPTNRGLLCERRGWIERQDRREKL